MAPRNTESGTARTLRESAAGGEGFQALVGLVMDGTIDEAIVKLGASEVGRLVHNACISRLRAGLTYRDEIAVGDTVRLVNTSPKYLTQYDLTVTAVSPTGEISATFPTWADTGRYAKRTTGLPHQFRKVEPTPAPSWATTDEVTA